MAEPVADGSAFASGSQTSVRGDEKCRIPALLQIYLDKRAPVQVRGDSWVLGRLREAENLSGAYGRGVSLGSLGEDLVHGLSSVGHGGTELVSVDGHGRGWVHMAHDVRDPLGRYPWSDSRDTAVWRVSPRCEPSLMPHSRRSMPQHGRQLTRTRLRRPGECRRAQTTQDPIALVPSAVTICQSMRPSVREGSPVRSSPLSLPCFGAATEGNRCPERFLDAELGCSPGELELGVDVEFRVSVAQVCFDGAFAEEQVPGDVRR